MQVVAYSKRLVEGVPVETYVFDNGLVVTYEEDEGTRTGTHAHVDLEDLDRVVSRLQGLRVGSI